MIKHISFLCEKKEDFMIEQNFKRTQEALAQLKDCVNNLKLVLEAKKDDNSQKETYESNMQKIDTLKQALNTALDTIDKSVQTINEVIEDNGTSINSY